MTPRPGIAAAGLLLLLLSGCVSSPGAGWDFDGQSGTEAVGDAIRVANMDLVADLVLPEAPGGRIVLKIRSKTDAVISLIPDWETVSAADGTTSPLTLAGVEAASQGTPDQVDPHGTAAFELGLKDGWPVSLKGWTFRFVYRIGERDQYFAFRVNG